MLSGGSHVLGLITVACDMLHSAQYVILDD